MARILLIESEQALLETLREELEDNGFTVDPATNGAEALRKLKNAPQLIVLDGLLNDLDGIVLLAQIKQDAAAKNVPVILLLEAGDENRARKAADLGVTKSVVKTHAGLQGICEAIKKYLPTE